MQKSIPICVFWEVNKKDGWKEPQVWAPSLRSSLNIACPPWRWPAWWSSQLPSPRHLVVSLSSGNKFCVYWLLPRCPQFPSHSPSSEECVPYSAETRYECKLRAVPRISICLSPFSDHFLLQLSRVLAAHSHPSEAAAAGAAKEKEAQAALSGAGFVRAGAGFAVALVLTGTLGPSLASDFLQPLDGTKNAAVASACSWKITYVSGSCCG